MEPGRRGKRSGQGQKTKPQSDTSLVSADRRVSRPKITDEGTLYVVATPIGNLEDITLRAARILGEVDLIAAEDTRHTRKLLTHLGISKPLTSYFDHNSRIKGASIIRQLHDGASVALVTDAGTPCISDPGYQLVRDAVAEGLTVVPVPGVSAVAAAISVSGLPADSFYFHGFLPPKAVKRGEVLQRLARSNSLLVIYESPQRLVDALDAMLSVFGDREAVVCRELTKLHEEFVRGNMSAILRHFEKTPPRGEVVVLVAPGSESRKEEIDIQLLLREKRDEGLSLRDAVKTVTEATCVPRSEVYRLAIAIFSDLA